MHNGRQPVEEFNVTDVCNNLSLADQVYLFGGMSIVFT